MKSWNDAKKRLEQDFLAPSLRGRVAYFMTRYTHAHDEAGRVAVRVDGKEVLKGFDMDWWMNSSLYKAEALRRFPEIADLKTPEERWERIYNVTLDLGCLTTGAFYDAWETFENESIEESLNGKNALVRLFAILDRRVGKRRLRELWDAGWGREPAWLLPFFCLRLEAEGIRAPEYAAVSPARAEELPAVAALAAKLWEHPAEELEADFAALLGQPEAALFTAERGGEIVGFAQCQLRHDYVEGTSSSPVGYLEGIYVEEAHRNRGVAAALLRACEAWVKEKGCTEFASDCELTNMESLRFHRALGFEEANRIICFRKALIQETQPL